MTKRNRSQTNNLATVITALILAPISVTASAQDDSNDQEVNNPLDQCRSAATALNDQTPVTVDERTTLTKVACEETDDGGRIVYRNDVDLGNADPADFEVEQLREGQRSQWCNNSRLRPLLEHLTVRYTYHAESSGSRIGSLTHRVSDCQ